MVWRMAEQHLTQRGKVIMKKIFILFSLNTLMAFSLYAGTSSGGISSVAEDYYWELTDQPNIDPDMQIQLPADIVNALRLSIGDQGIYIKSKHGKERYELIADYHRRLFLQSEL